ncbi:HU family DNA-binding protein [Parabacteroides distasonis]|nr:HU family DNA-binding protein [Parabacteroides distasonis]
MPQAFQARKFFIPKTDPKQEVYKPVPYYFGTLSTQDAADQIAEESSLTKGDVLNVLDRYQRYVIKNLQKGYKVELLGFGTVYNRFVTEKGWRPPRRSRLRIYGLSYRDSRLPIPY